MVGVYKIRRGCLQIQHNHPMHQKYYRDETKGGWPFSTHDIGWIVADCTGEGRTQPYWSFLCQMLINPCSSGLKAALLCKKHQYTTKPLDDSRIFDAVNMLLKMQNSSGGLVLSYLLCSAYMHSLPHILATPPVRRRVAGTCLSCSTPARCSARL